MKKKLNSSPLNAATKPLVHMDININTFPLIEAQVTIIIEMMGFCEGDSMSIPRTTFLLTDDGTTKCKLLHAMNIALSPNKTCLTVDKSHTFLLFFTPLPIGCKLFELVAQSPEKGFKLLAYLKRNNEDIYRV
jgi:hypothetical protein